MKKTKIVVPALAVLLLSTAASVSGTVAWFSMNNSVKVDGMTVTTRVSSNLLIAEHNHEDQYQDSITQARSGIIEPASTVNGKNYFYTVNALGNGDAKQDTYGTYNENTALANAGAGKTNYDVGFNSSYGVEQAQITTSNVMYGYIDYAFYIKATSAADDQVLYMSKCNLLYDTQDYATNPSGDPIWSAISNGYAWRVALLSGTAQKETAFDDTDLALKTILAPANALNQNQVNQVNTSAFTEQTSVADYFTDPYGKTAASGTYQAGTKYYSAPSTTPNAVSAANAAPTAVSNPNAAAQAATNIDIGVTSYTRIVVRLWLEGEDISCTSNTYAQLTSKWKLSLEFKLGNATDGGNPATANGVAQLQSDPALNA